MKDFYMGQGKVKFEIKRDKLKENYKECLELNPALGRMEGELKTVNWTEEEIRTAQLLTACISNGQLAAKNLELETELKSLYEKIARHPTGPHR